MESMNRRGFFGLLGKLAAVGTAMSVHPALLEPFAKHILFVDSTMGPVTITLPPVSRRINYIIRHVKGSHPVTIR